MSNMVSGPCTHHGRWRRLWRRARSLEQGSAAPKGWGWQAASSIRAASACLGSKTAILTQAQIRLASPLSLWSDTSSRYHPLFHCQDQSYSRVIATLKLRVCAYLLCLPILIYCVPPIFKKHFTEYFPSVIRSKTGLQFPFAVLSLACFGVKKILFTALALLVVTSFPRHSLPSLPPSPKKSGNSEFLLWVYLLVFGLCRFSIYSSANFKIVFFNPDLKILLS